MTFAAACRDQARSCAALGSPFTARLLTLAADRLTPGAALADRVLGWPGDISSRGASVPLRLAGALHALVLDGSDPDLAAAYANPSEDDAVWAAVAGALARHEARLMRWLDNPPQTNEVARSAVLIAAGHWLAARFGLPLVLSELGASAGLNLLWDRYALALPDGTRFGPADPALTLSPDWTGAAPPAADVRVADRAGVDLAPVDPVADRLRLMAYVWPDQPARLARLAAAMAEAARHPSSPVERGDAAGWLSVRLAARRAGALHLVFHTVAWQYFPPDTQARCRADLDRAGAQADADAPLARLSMEADADGPGAALRLTLWPAGAEIDLGRADFHGRWIDWQAPPLPAPAARLS